MKKIITLIQIISLMFLLLPETKVCSLSPTAKIVTDPDGTVFYHNEAVLLDGTTSTANYGSINQYCWQVDDVAVSCNAVYSHTFMGSTGTKPFI